MSGNPKWRLCLKRRLRSAREIANDRSDDFGERLQDSRLPQALRQRSPDNQVLAILMLTAKLLWAEVKEASESDVSAVSAPWAEEGLREDVAHRIPRLELVMVEVVVHCLIGMFRS
jgi:hypothetical protein